MKKLVIITGISGTGKSTLAKILYEKIENSTLLSSDKLKECIYDITGFKNIDEKNHIRTLKTDFYKKIIEECMRRKDELIILERPFKIEWKEFFNNLSTQYNYEMCTINMFAKNFDTIWNRLQKREYSKEERHPSHYLTSYCPKKKDKYEPYFEYNYNNLKNEYEELKSNSINLGKVINIEDIEKLDIESLISEILK